MPWGHIDYLKGGIVMSNIMIRKLFKTFDTSSVFVLKLLIVHICIIVIMVMFMVGKWLN